MYSCLSGQIAAERRRDLLAEASAGRLARQARTGREPTLRQAGPRA